MDAEESVVSLGNGMYISLSGRRGQKESEGSFVMVCAGISEPLIPRQSVVVRSVQVVPYKPQPVSSVVVRLHVWSSCACRGDLLVLRVGGALGAFAAGNPRVTPKIRYAVG